MIQTGIKKLDQILGGGIRNGTITDIYGASGTGKTQLAIQISKNSLINGGQVFFQDTTGEFRPERLHQLLKNHEIDTSLMNNVTVARITNTSEQISYLSKIPKSVFTLVVIDNVTDLFSFEFAKEELSLEKNLSFMKYMHSLSQICIENKIPVVITNMIRNNKDTEIENLEKSIGLFTHVKIKLSKNATKFHGIVNSPITQNDFYYKISPNGVLDSS